MERNPNEEARPPLLPASAALYLDFDGTLAHIAATPDSVVISRRLPGLLNALRARMGGAVAVITGRRLADIDSLLAPAVLPGVGLHGAELRLKISDRVTQNKVGGVAPLVAALKARFGTQKGLIVEDKGAGAALHFRLAPERAQECIEAMRELAGRARLDVLVGNMVVEARKRGINKGRALRTLAAHRPFKGRVPVFIGDDTTDEDGFAAAERMGGYGIKVGGGDSAARYRWSSVEDVHDWLRRSIHAQA